MKIISWNVNGIRACGRTGFSKWFESENADIVCVQEIKANPEQVDAEIRNPLNRHSFWNPAQKPGYSGTAIYSKKEPLSIQNGFQRPGSEIFDHEGRVMIAEFPEVTVLNAYFPNSQREHTRLDYKIAFCKMMQETCQELVAKGKHVVLCGDYNVAHEEIDLRNPKANMNNAGFLPQERAWMTQFLGAGFVDSFRRFEKGGGHYTWWSYRPGVREKNIGWRLDYHCVNSELEERLKSASIQCDTRGSDHCPVILEIKD